MTHRHRFGSGSVFYSPHLTRTDGWVGVLRHLQVRVLMHDERREAELTTVLNITLILTGFMGLVMCMMHTSLVPRNSSTGTVQ